MAALLGAVGCHSIQSDAVRQLIQKEQEKIAETTANSKTIVEATKSRVEAMQKAEGDLDSSLQQLHRIEDVHTLVFSSNQNVISKQGEDAHAVAYFVGRIYLADAMGLDAKVSQQFEADRKALTSTAIAIEQSWKGISEQHQKIVEYSKKSGLSGVDVDLISSVAGQIPGASEEIAKVLERGKQINDALEKAAALSPLAQSEIGQARSLTQEFLDLLSRVKPQPSQP
jgi:phosphoheptose isomerase